MLSLVWVFNVLAWAYAMAGRRRDAIMILDDLKDPSKQVRPGKLAMIYSALGEKDLAMAQLEKAYAKPGSLLWLKVDPAFDGMRSDARFSDLIGRIRFPQ